MTQKTEQEVIDFLNSDSYQIEQVFAEKEALAKKLIEFFYGEVTIPGITTTPRLMTPEEMVENLNTDLLEGKE